MGNFKEEIAKIEAFAFDVDGVLTDGGMMMLPDGDFLRKYHAKDGFAMAYALKKGYKVAIITAGYGELLERRFKHLMNVSYFTYASSDKLASIKEYMEKFSLSKEQVLYMGDDVPDVEAMKYVGISVAPADASNDALLVAKYVSQYNGGHGAARDIIEQVLRARGDWNGDVRGFGVLMPRKEE